MANKKETRSKRDKNAFSAQRLRTERNKLNAKLRLARRKKDKPNPQGWKHPKPKKIEFVDDVIVSTEPILKASQLLSRLRDITDNQTMTES